ncbi:hypothetical protein D3C72_2323000 [compost metagenome]
MAPPTPNTKRETKKRLKSLAKGESAAHEMHRLPIKTVRLMPILTASRPVTRGATTLATETRVVISPNWAAVMWKLVWISALSGVTAIHERPKTA